MHWGSHGDFEARPPASTPSKKEEHLELLFFKIQCNLDLATENLVTTCDLVTTVIP